MKLFRNNVHRDVSTIAQQQLDARPAFDRALSEKLDQVICQLDQHPRGLRLLRLRLEKRWLERKVPG